MIDLGVMCSCEKILKRAIEEKVDMIGLSGLITPSLDEMVHVARRWSGPGSRCPLLIGGATTSVKHTAVKISPNYHGPVVPRQGCVAQCGRGRPVEPRPRLAVELDTENRGRCRRSERESFSKRRQQRKLVPYAEALARRFTIDWGNAATIADAPRSSEPEVLNNLPARPSWFPYIDWSPFFMTWELKGKYPRIFDDPVGRQGGQEALRRRQTSSSTRWSSDGSSYPAHGVYGFFPPIPTATTSWSTPMSREPAERARFPMLRQQWEREGQTSFRSLADYVAPVETGLADYLGAFAVTTGDSVRRHSPSRFERDFDDYNAIMAKALADRLAEAFAECLHERARGDWGYGKRRTAFEGGADRARKYRGIRPAAGYPSCPDHTEKKTLWNLLDVESATGIALTESYAMFPAASVSGLYFAHPEARYFAVDLITRDQVEPYAERKRMPRTEVERWLSPNLGYDPS